MEKSWQFTLIRELTMNKVMIIGTGPWNKEYLIPFAKKEIEKSDCLIGSKRLLNEFKEYKKDKIILKTNYDEIISYIKKNKNEKKIAVLVSGDPCLFSFSNMLMKALNKNEYIIISGISSLQIAFARIGETWHNVKIISLHGNDINDSILKEINQNEKIFIFTDKKHSPDKIARNMIKFGIKNRKIFVFENLTYKNEKIINTDIPKLAKMRGFDLCVMIIMKKSAIETAGYLL